MKGAMGLTIAAGLGIIGAVCNWLYLQQLAKEQETVQLIAVREGVRLNIGDPFKESDLEPVPIPRIRVGNLLTRAPQWIAKDAVVGIPANRVFEGGEVIIHDDLEAPAVRSLASTLQEDEVARPIPIDARSVVSEHINPGDLVSFEVARGARGPTPAESGDEPTPPGAGNSATEIIGPFRVLALGTRRESPNVEQAARGRAASNANTITIVVKLVKGQLEPQAARLFEALRLSGNQGVGVLLHSSRAGGS